MPSMRSVRVASDHGTKGGIDEGFWIPEEAPDGDGDGLGRTDPVTEPADGLVPIARGDELGNGAQCRVELLRSNSPEQRLDERCGVERNLRAARERKRDRDGLVFGSLHAKRMGVRDSGRASREGGDGVESGAANKAAGDTRIAPPLPNDPPSYRDRAACFQFRPFIICSKIQGGPAP